MRLWHWLRRRTSPPDPCPRWQETPEDVLRDMRHQQQVREQRERLQELSDELSLIQRRDQEHS